MDKLFIPVDDLRPIDVFIPELLVLVKSFNKVVVTSTVQFKHRVNDVVNALAGHEVIVAPSVLGCRALIPDSDCVVLIATGVFHAINIGLITSKPVFIIGPDGVSRLDDSLVSSLKKRRAVMIAKVLDAKVIGVLLSVKSGQSHESLAEDVVVKLNSLGKEAYLFVADNLSSSQLNDFPVDAWVNTACPRIVEDEFDKPIVNWSELVNYM